MKVNKKLILILVLLVYTNDLFAFQENSVSDLVLFFGRFHPVLLHLPIGGLVVIFCMDIIGRKRMNYPKKLIVDALGITALFTLATAILGYCLSLEGGYGEQPLQLHKISGIIMTILTIGLYLSAKSNANTMARMYYPLYGVVLLTTIITGHYGSILTHGEDFLTAYANLGEAESTAVVVEIDSLNYFPHVIRPMVDDKCVKCHNNNKKKGGLNLTSVAHILEGGENGSILEPGNAAESSLYKVLLLPMEDELHMPPSGKPQLSSNEIWLLKHWINTGAFFDKKITDYAENDTLNKLLPKYLIFPKENVSEAKFGDIVAIQNHGFNVSKVIFDKPYLRATYSNSAVPVSKKAIQSLVRVSNQLVELNLQGSGLTDANSSVLKKLKKLKKLRLDDNPITEKSLAHLESLEKLEFLNLFNTKVSSARLEEMLRTIALTKVIVGDESEINESQEIILGDTEVQSGILSGFIEKSALQQPMIVGEQSIFDTDIAIEIKGQLRNERIYYTVDGQDPDSTSLPYTTPVTITENTVLKAISYKDGWYPSTISSRNYNKIRYTIPDITVKYPPKEQYPGVHKLIDLSRGSENFRDGKWNGYQDDVIATIDMEKEIDLNKIAVNCLEGIGSYIFFPTKIEVYAGTTALSMEKLNELTLPPTDRDRDIKLRNFEIQVEPVKARYIKIVLRNIGKLPDWHEGAGSDAWIFVDEIMIL